MAVSSNLEIFQLQESQSAKATAANEAIRAMELALSDQYSLDTSAATSAGFDVVIPFDTATDLSSRRALRFISLVLTAGASADFDVVHPANKHLFVVQNSTTQTATLKCAGQAGTPLGAGAGGLFYCNGSDVVEIDLSTGSGGTNIPTKYEMLYVGSPPSSTVIAKFLLTETINFAANFAGSFGKVATNPASQYLIDVQDDGASIGTIAISAAGAVTFSTTSGTAKIVSAGSVIRFVSAASPAPNLTEIHVALRGIV